MSFIRPVWMTRVDVSGSLCTNTNEQIMAARDPA